MSTPISGDNSNNLYISRQMADALKNKEAQKLVNDILSDGKVDRSDNTNITKLRAYLENAAKQDDGKIDADEDALLDSIDSTGLFGTNREVVKTNLTALRNSDAEANSLNFEQGVGLTTQGGISGFFGGQQARVIQLRTTTAELDPKSAYTEITKLPEDKQQALAPMVENARTADEQLLKQATQLRDALTDPSKVSDAALETGKPAGMTVAEYRQHLLNTVNNYIANPSDASFRQLKEEMYEENWAFESEATANSAGVSKETYEVFQGFKGSLQAREQNHAALNERISAFADNQFTTPSDPSEINSSLAQNEASAKSKVSEFTEQANQVINYLKQDSVNYPGKQEDIARLEALVKKTQTEPMGQENLDALNELWGAMEEVAFKTNIRSAGNDTIAQNTAQIESIKAADPDSAATLSLIQKTPQVIEHAALLEQLEKYPELKEAVLKGDSEAVSRLFAQSMDASPPSFMLPRNTSSMFSLDFGLGYGSLSSPYSYNYFSPSSSFGITPATSGLNLNLGMNTDLTGGFTNTSLYSMGSSFDDQTGLGFGGVGSRLAPTNFAADPNFTQNQALIDSILPQNNIGNLWREVSLSDVNALMNAMSQDPALGAAVASPEAAKINSTIQSHEQLKPIMEQANAASNYSTAFNKAFWQNNSLLEQAQAEVGKTINTRNNTISELEYSKSQITSALSDPNTSPEMKTQLQNQQKILDTALQELRSGGVLSENTMGAIAPITRALNNKDQNMTLSQKLGQEAVVNDFNAVVQSGEMGKLVESMLQSPNVPDSQKQALASLNNQLELETILNNPAVSPQLKQSLLEGMQFATRAAKSHAENPSNLDAILSEQHSFNGLPANGLMALTGLGGANKYINDNPGVDPSHFLNDMTTRLSALSQQQFDSPEAFQQAVQEQAEAAGRSESERLANSVAQLKGIEDSWSEALNSQTEVQRQETLAALTRTANSLRGPDSDPIPPLRSASDIVKLPPDVLAKLSNSGSEIQKLESEVAALRQQVYPVDQQGRALRSSLSPEELVRQRALLTEKTAQLQDLKNIHELNVNAPQNLSPQTLAAARATQQQAIDATNRSLQSLTNNMQTMATAVGFDMTPYMKDGLVDPTKIGDLRAALLQHSSSPNLSHTQKSQVELMMFTATQMQAGFRMLNCLETFTPPSKEDIDQFAIMQGFQMGLQSAIDQSNGGQNWGVVTSFTTRFRDAMTNDRTALIQAIGELGEGGPSSPMGPMGITMGGGHEGGDPSGQPVSGQPAVLPATTGSGSPPADGTAGGPQGRRPGLGEFVFGHVPEEKRRILSGTIQNMRNFQTLATTLQDTPLARELSRPPSHPPIPAPTWQQIEQDIDRLSTTVETAPPEERANMASTLGQALAVNNQALISMGESFTQLNWALNTAAEEYGLETIPPDQMVGSPSALYFQSRSADTEQASAAAVAEADALAATLDLSPKPTKSGNELTSELISDFLKTIQQLGADTRKLILARMAVQMLDRVIGERYKAQADEANKYHKEALDKMIQSFRDQIETSIQQAEAATNSDGQRLAAMSGEHAGIMGDANIRSKVEEILDRTMDISPPIMTDNQKRDILNQLFDGDPSNDSLGLMGIVNNFELQRRSLMARGVSMN